jgi:rubrerythrin
MDQGQVEKFILEALETEIGGAKIYEEALQCAQNEELQEEWQKYLEQTREHAHILREACEQLGIDVEQDAPGRQIVRANGEALVELIHMARESGEPQQAQVVAAEAVMLAESKDHLNWELLELIAKQAQDDRYGEVLRQAVEQVEDQEDEHLFHGTGWARELRAEALGLPAELPPPEEDMKLKTRSAPRRKAKHA